MSIGVHTGAVDFLLVGHHNRELVVTGPGATTVALMEKVADAGEVVVSAATAEAVRAAGGTIGEAKGPGWLLVRSPAGIAKAPIRAVEQPADLDLGVALPAPLREHLLDGAVEGEHRHVAVGFIEFSGADALAVADDPELLTTAVDHVIATSQDAADANDVTILSTDVNADGGKIIVISGAPRRVGDDEARVLTTLRSVLDAGGALSLRAGVTSGRVFAGDFGPAYRRNYSVAGDCVNLAARLMGAARPGQLLAAGAVLDRAGPRFETTPVPPFTVKGKAEPVVAHSVGAARTDRAFVTSDAVPLIGRDEELGALLEAVEAVRAGTGRTVDLVGPPGIGKSRLLEELAAVSGCPILWVDGDIYGEAAPYKPVRKMVREQLGIGANDSRRSVADAFHRFVAGRAPQMVPWLPLVGRVVDADFPMTEVVAEIDLGARKERMEWAISELLAAIIDEPTILVFNDAHLMDEATVALMRRLNADAHERPWLVVTSYRPDDRATIAEGTTVIELAPLDDAASDALLAAMTDASPLPHHQLQALAQRASGNPLFLRELAAGALEDGLVTELPDSIEGIVSSRIDRLNPARRRTLRAAAVLGMVVDLTVFDAMIRADGGFSGATIDELRGLQEFIADVDAERLRFRHHLAREAAYEGLSYRRRTALHARTADAIEEVAGPERDDRADLLSLHCFHGARYDDAWRYSVLAGDRARAQYANAEAADCYRRALQAAERLGRGSGIDIGPVAEALGDVCFELGEFDDAERALRRALHAGALAPDVEARRCMKVARIRETTGRYSAALRWLSKGRAALHGVGTPEGELALGQLLVSQARVRYFQGRNRDAVRWATQAREHAERIGDDQTLAQALESLDLASMALGEVDVTPRSTRSLAIYEASGDLSGQGRIHNSLGMRAYFRGRWPEAIQHYTSAAEAYRRAGRTWIAAVSQANAAEVLSDQGHLDDAREIFEASMRVWRGIRAGSELAFGGYMLGRIAARSGRLDDALAHYEPARRFCRSAGEQVEVVLIDVYVAEAHLLGGDPGRALELADAVLADARAMDGQGAPLSLALRVRAEALLQVGDAVAGVAALRESLGVARRRDALHDVAHSLDLLLRVDADATMGERAEWRAERDELWTRLGMAPQDHPQPLPPASPAG
jgi:class 3 adenylate cyclase/tetratricopeptide (TPR) repeat protein